LVRLIPVTLPSEPGRPAMIGLSLFAATVAVTLVMFTVLCAVVTRDPTFQPATVNPFAGPAVADPAAETLAMGTADPTLAGDWKQAELDSLSDVEDLLDRLEACHVRHREMNVVGNDKFVVRWR
jgi:hypothetical protein